MRIIIGGGEVLGLTNNTNTLRLFEWIGEREKVEILSDAINVKMIERIRPKLIVSYNYIHIVPNDVIEMMPNKIVNLHISFLPYNRGFAPNIWSFWENTKKGVTIHEIDAGLDTGAIICQKELFFDENKETFRTSYDKLQDAIVELFKENWDNIVSGGYEAFCSAEKGSYHDKKDLKRLLGGQDMDYGEVISEWKKRMEAKGKLLADE